MDDESQEYQNGGWPSWSRWVIQSIKDIKSEVKELQDAFHKLQTEVTVLKVKMTIYGGVGGAVVTLAFQLVVSYLKGKAGGP